MADVLQRLYDKHSDLVNKARKLIDLADTESRPLTGEEEQEWERIDGDVDSLSVSINRHEKLRKQEEFLDGSQGRVTALLDVCNDIPEPSNADQSVDVSFGRHTASIQPGTVEYERQTDDYKSQFGDYITGGNIGATLQVASNPKGGYLTTTTFIAQLIQKLDDMVFMRELANVLPPLQRAVSLGVPTLDTDPDDADWVSEILATDKAEDTSLAFGGRELTPHMMMKHLKVSMKLLQTAVIDPESIIRDRLAVKYAITEEKGFLTGDGAQQPLGVFTASASGISTARDVTAASATTVVPDDMIETFYNLKEPYMRNATWLVSRALVKLLRKKKTTNGDYIWQQGLSVDRPSTILDRPYVMSEFTPNTFASGLYTAIVGDFNAGYWIVDALDMEIQRLNEVGALQNKISFVGRKETDGMPVLEEAFSRLILA